MAFMLHGSSDMALINFQCCASQANEGLEIRWISGSPSAATHSIHEGALQDLVLVVAVHSNAILVQFMISNSVALSFSYCQSLNRQDCPQTLKASCAGDLLY
jgi:hypothetical protein